MKLISVDTHIQNKGLYIGRRQILLDFALSNLPYDHPLDPKVLERAKDHTPEEVEEKVRNLAKTPHQAICLGGGEPLLQVDLLKLFLAAEHPFPIYIETNATLPKNLAEIKDQVQLCGLALKPGYEKEFVESLLIVKDHEVFVRLITNKEITPKNVDSYAKIIAEVRPDIPLVIEPLKDCKEPLPLQAMALRHLQDVRVIPAINWGTIHA